MPIKQVLVGGKSGAGGTDYEEAVWHIGGTLKAGDNSTNYHHVRRAGSPFAAWVTIKGDLPTTQVIINIKHIERAGADKSLFRTTKLTVAAGVREGEQLLFANPLPVFAEKDHLDLDVVQAGGAARVQITIKYR